MSVSSLFSNVGSATDAVSALFTPTQSSAASTNGASSLTSAASSATVSGGASLLSQLAKLSQSDPTEFKKVTADIAAQLQKAAQATTGSQSTALSSLADRFQQASQTGDLSALKPAHAHHGGHHGGGAASAAAAYQQTTDTGTATSNDLQSQISGIISQVLTQDAGGSTSAA